MVFQPMCGTFSAGSEGATARTSPGMRSRPGITPCSRPRVARSCMPTQMPRNGRPRTVDDFVDRLDHAGDGIEAPPAIGEGAVAGEDDTVGLRDHIGIRL